VDTTSKAHEDNFDLYSKAILETNYTDFDFCLVDGRFRVACFIEALLFLKSGAVLAIHDYATRPAYHVVERFARPIAASGQLSFFVRRHDCNEKDARQVLESHRRNWA